MRTITHWIGGKPTAGSAEPHEPGLEPRHRRAAGRGDARRASTTSTPPCAPRRPRSSAGAQSSLSQRTKVLFTFRELVNSHVQELAEIISDEHGKVVSDARGEVQRGLEVIEFACGIPTLLKGGFSDQVSTGVDVYSFRQPLGVCVGITPFNFPAMVPMWMYPVAIATRQHLRAQAQRARPQRLACSSPSCGPRPGCPTACSTSCTATRPPSTLCSTHPDVAAVSFVGSTPIAKYIYEHGTANGKRVQALGGAKNHAIVLPDAAIDYASDHLVAAAFGSAGERCMAISAAVTVGSAGDDLIAAVSEKARAVKVGPGREAGQRDGSRSSRPRPGTASSASSAAARSRARDSPSTVVG